jgi:hypothetical protein
MTATVIIYRIDTTYTGSWGGTTYQAGYYIHVQFDTVTKELSVKIKGSADPSSSDIYSPTTGPNLFYGYDGAVTRVYPGNIADLYAACDGTTLDSIGTNSNFPYGTHSSSSDHPLCYIAPTCDLEISSEYTVTPASGPEDSDGGFQASATSSNGTPKFGLTEDFDYNASTNTSGSFTGYPAGTYTVYAKDSLGCLDSITITVPVTIDYGVRWRLDYVDDVNKIPSRIDILERSYDGDVEEITCGEFPITIEYKGEGNDQYKSIIPSEAIIRLKTQVSEQFADIFNGDDRKYLVKFYKGVSLEMKWTGFPIPELYEEPYYFEPFDTEVTATDGLAELSKLDFLDSNGNNYRGDLSVIKIISEILKTTGLLLNIRSCVNIFEDAMDDGVGDDPLAQAFVDTRIFYTDKNEPSDLETVLKAVLEPFGARVFQSRGYWWIQRIEYAVSTNVIYREFTPDGVYSSNGSLNPLYKLTFPKADEIDKTVFRDKSQRRGFNSNYGQFNIVHNLSRDENLIDEGRFEEQDYIDVNADGDTFFKNWRFLIGQTSETFGFEKLEDGTGAFFAKFSQFTSVQNDSQLYTVDIPIKVLGAVFGVGDFFKVKFDVKIIPFNLVPWVRIAWQLRITNNNTGDYYEMYPAFGDRQDYEINEEVVNTIYIEDFGQFKTFDLGFFSSPVDSGNASVKLTLRFHNHYGKDFNYLGRDRNGGFSYDASTGLFPTSGIFHTVPDSPAAILTGDTVRISPGGTIQGVPVAVGQDLMALVDNPTQSWLDWRLGNEMSLLTKQTADLDLDYRVYYGDLNQISTVYYKLEKNTEAESRPGRVRPLDYDVSTNPRQWILKEDLFLGRNASLIQKILFDNVQIAFFPFISDINGSGNIEPPENSIYSQSVNTNVKLTLTKPVLLGDAPDFNNANLVYKGFFKLSDGTPTMNWHRQGVTESLPLLQLLLNNMVTQMAEPVRKLMGDTVSNGFIDYINFYEDYLDSRRYINTHFIIEDKKATYSLTVVNLLVGPAGEPPVDGGAYDPDSYDNTAYDI